MDHKPIITYSGDVAVFQAVAPSLQKGIGAEAVEWKRAYGRTTKHVHLHPRFIPFKPGETLGGGVAKDDGPNTGLTTLLDQSMLHTYWTDCSDVELYRTTTKDNIQTWLNQVKASNIRDWLLVLVEAPDNKKTKQLLPRTSVLDKIKSDFAQKQVERCISLSDPTKLDSKSTESILAMLHRLRLLLLASYSKTLTKFEENMRAQREKRNEPGWNFCHYFLLQEELAFVLEMLEVYDEALVQYDELDALFTQFVLNSHLTDTPQWLLSFQRSGDQWPALTLSSTSSKVLLDTREKIKNSTVSLVSFRNYLFARQAALLIKQKGLHELAQRSLPFLHNGINELSILDVTFTEEGATNAWVFVSCLEILGTVCGHGQDSLLHSNAVNGNGVSEQSNAAMSAADFSVHTAGLWDYAREKLYELGKLCDLLPQSKPKSDHLHKVISLAAGLVPFQDQQSKMTNHVNAISTDSNRDSAIEIPGLQILLSPIEKLKNALSSKEQFQTYYLELCELAMGTYKHIGRIRCARKVGLSLASYYMDSLEHQKAISFLTDALKTFKNDKWNLLVVEVLLRLAMAYKATNDLERYIRTTAQLASSQELSQDKRDIFFVDFQNSLDLFQNGDGKNGIILAPVDDAFLIKSVKVDTLGKINVDSCDVNINLEMESQFPKCITCTCIEIGIVLNEIHHSTSSSPNQPKTSNRGDKNVKEGERGKGRLDRKESILSVPVEEEDFLCNINASSPPQLRLQFGQTFEMKQDKSVQGGKITCHNSHLALRRKDSQAKSEIQLTKTEFSFSAKSSNIQLNPGINSLVLFGKVSTAGSYRLGQVSIRIKMLDYISPRFGPTHTFNVEKVPGSLTLGEECHNLIAGIEQILILKINTGSNQIKDNMVLNVRSSVGLQLKTHDNSPFSSEVTLPLPIAKSFCQREVTLKVKAELGPQKDNSPIQHKLMVKCPWSGEETKLSVSFQPPLMSSFKVHSSGGCRKFVQVFLHGLNDNTFLISNHKLVVQGAQAKDVPLVPLNPRSQELSLRLGENASYMFEIGVNELDDENSTRMEFSTTFRPLDKSYPAELYKFYFCLTHFKTQYEIKYRVEPHKGLEFCRVGTMCSLVVDIVKILPIKSVRDTETSLMYEVRADQHMWAICGRTSGVVSMEGVEAAQVALEVMPMSPGFLPLPTVYLSNYIPADIKGTSSSVPKLEPFNSGQVFNRCKGMQIHVLPPYSGSSGSGTSSLTNTNDIQQLPVTEYSE